MNVWAAKLLSPSTRHERPVDPYRTNLRLYGWRARLQHEVWMRLLAPLERHLLGLSDIEP